jgi:DNA polymerase-3 subunit beta
MQTLPREDFPTLPDASGTARATLPRAAVKEMVAKTQYAITGEDTRYFLNGAKFVLKRHSLTLVATDGHRLALVDVKHETGVSQDVGVILPKKTLLELGKLLAEGDGDIQLESGENHLFFEVGGRILISHMIDGQFPAYERVIPKGNDKTIEFDRERLTNERSRAVKFEIDKGKVEVTSSSSEFGEAHEQLPVEYAGPALSISFNAQYVLDFLNVVETDIVSLSLKDEVSQAVMKPVGAEGYDYTYVIMPMRI